MGYPVKMKNAGFVHLGEEFNKGDVFNAPTAAMASFLCDQEKMATRVKESDLEPEQPGTNKRKVRGSYNTKVMTPDADSEPVSGKERKPAPVKKKAAPRKNNN